MGQTLDLGKRLELQPMDQHCHDISLALYQRDVDGEPQFLVHTYSSDQGAAGRVDYIGRAMAIMLGLEEVADATCSTGPRWFRFACGTIHERAIKRAFLDLFKLAPDAVPQPKPLTAFDKKADCKLTTVPLGGGVYEMRPEQDTDAGRKRAVALARGFAKLCEIEQLEGHPTRVAFGCKTNHDALMGMLMFRAQNVRAAMAEQEQAASRGVLSAPSAQDK